LDASPSPNPSAGRIGRILSPWYLLALALGLALRLWFIAHHSRIDGDTLIYGDIASNWLQHGVYGFTTQAPLVPRPTLIRLPGYPLFLVGCFRVFGVERYLPVMFVQAGLDLFTCGLLASLAGRLFGRRARIPALWLACLCPFTASYVSAPLTETLSLLAIAAAFYGLLRWKESGASVDRWLLMVSVALGYAILLRPEQGLLAASVLPAMVWISLLARKSIVPVAVAALLTLLPLVPWTIRNQRTFHVFQPLAPRFANDPGEFVPLGFQRWFRTWAIDFASTEDVYWNYDGSPVSLDDLPNRAFDSDEQFTETALLLEDYNQASNATPALDRRFDAIAAERIRFLPLRYYVALPISRVVNMILRPRVEYLPIPLEWWNFHKRPKAAAFAALYGILNLAYLVAAMLGFRRWRAEGWAGNQAIAWSLAASILLRIALLLTIDNSEPRYTLEFFPVLFVLGAAVFTYRTAFPRTRTAWYRHSSR
jgi:4-amino-4-deoxy-L-arabinose transferase-like glycosyltransferase